jgi:glycogen(starch) synthase
MRVFMFSTAFAPNIGGIETLAALLAEEFVALGHEVRVMTDARDQDRVARPYRVHRGHSAVTYLAWLHWCDAHLQFNVSLKRLLPLLARRRWFVAHGAEYIATDGRTRLRDRLKLAAARGAHNIACSGFILRQLGRQGVVIGNAYDDRCYRLLGHDRAHELAFVGRLVSQKGCDVLLRSLGELARTGLRPALTVIGDGEERGRLEELARAVGVARQVTFRGALAPAAIADMLNRHRILVVPSSYREPFGIVALEGLACGCGLVVSAEGGLVEAAGGHARTFRNGDPASLAAALRAALCEPEPRAADRAAVAIHLAGHTRRAVAERYLEAFAGGIGAPRQ